MSDAYHIGCIIPYFSYNVLYVITKLTKLQLLYDMYTVYRWIRRTIKQKTRHAALVDRYINIAIDWLIEGFPTYMYKWNDSSTAKTINEICNTNYIIQTNQINSIHVIVLYSVYAIIFGNFMEWPKCSENLSVRPSRLKIHDWRVWKIQTTKLY